MARARRGIFTQNLREAKARTHQPTRAGGSRVCVRLEAIEFVHTHTPHTHTSTATRASLCAAPRSAYVYWRRIGPVDRVLYTHTPPPPLPPPSGTERTPRKRPKIKNIISLLVCASRRLHAACPYRQARPGREYARRRFATPPPSATQNAAAERAARTEMQYVSSVAAARNQNKTRSLASNNNNHACKPHSGPAACVCTLLATIE